jgi:hypothetical protein
VRGGVLAAGQGVAAWAALAKPLAHLGHARGPRREGCIADRATEAQKLSAAIYEHETRAAELQARGDYRAAAREQETIERMRSELARLEWDVDASTYSIP